MRTLQISEETYQKIKEQLQDEELKIGNLDELIGKAWFIRTVTYHLTGMVTARIGDFLVLKDAAWIADSGRFMNAIKDGKLNEVEPVGDAIVNLGSITDMFPWRHALPVKQV